MVGNRNSHLVPEALHLQGWPQNVEKVLVSLTNQVRPPSQNLTSDFENLASDLKMPTGIALGCGCCSTHHSTTVTTRWRLIAKDLHEGMLSAPFGHIVRVLLEARPKSRMNSSRSKVSPREPTTPISAIAAANQG